MRPAIVQNEQSFTAQMKTFSEQVAPVVKLNRQVSQLG